MIKSIKQKHFIERKQKMKWLWLIRYYYKYINGIQQWNNINLYVIIATRYKFDMHSWSICCSLWLNRFTNLCENVLFFSFSKRYRVIEWNPK